MTHESEGCRERGAEASFAFDPRPDSEQGFSAAIRHAMAAQASGGADALQGSTTLVGHAADAEGDALDQRTLEIKFGYGFAVGDRFTATLEAELTLSSGQCEYTLDWRPGLTASGPVSMELEWKGKQGEPDEDGGEPVNAQTLRGAMRG